MVELAKILKFGKKGAKAAGGRKGKVSGGSAYDWPSGTRIGVFGHANSGKTVYFTVLNEECKISKDLQIAVTDSATAGQLLTNYRALWGIGASSDVGTVVDLHEEKKFPPATQRDLVMQFTATVDRKYRESIVTYEYNGQAVSISDRHELNDKVIDFMRGCDGLLFFFDPKALAADLQCQAHVAAFVNMMEQLAPLNKRLRIPVGLVITKADVLHGFKGDHQVVLVPEEEESLFAEDFEVFFERVLASNRIAADSTWAGSVRNLLVKLQEFLKVVVGRTLNFQIFFTSATGQPPLKIGSDVGRSVYAPPDRITPIGVREPFRWILRSIVRNRRIERLRKISRFVVIASLIWMIAYSLPNLFHFAWLLPNATRVEDNILESHRGNVMNTSDDERSKIIRAYGDYERSLTTRWLFPKYQVPARQIRNNYEEFNLGDAVARLDNVIGRFSAIVRDQNLWPAVNPATDSLILTETHTKLQSDLEAFHQGDEESILFRRSGRALTYWGLFQSALVNRTDSRGWDLIGEQSTHDNSLYGNEMNKAENDMIDALVNASRAGQAKTEARETARQAGGELDQLVTQINANEDPNYRLVDAVTRLESIRGALAGNPARQKDVERINTYLSQASHFKNSQGYEFTLTNCPDGHHVHILVKKGGKTGEWPPGQQLHKGRSASITWRMGDHILIALDRNDHGGQDEKWGAEPKALKELKSKTAVFDMDGDVVFPSGETITISFKQDLKEKLPKF